jgi:hypothetical protein
VSLSYILSFAYKVTAEKSYKTLANLQSIFFSASHDLSTKTACVNCFTSESKNFSADFPSIFVLAIPHKQKHPRNSCKSLDNDAKILHAARVFCLLQSLQDKVPPVRARQIPAKSFCSIPVSPQFPATPLIPLLWEGKLHLDLERLLSPSMAWDCRPATQMSEQGSGQRQTLQTDAR